MKQIEQKYYNGYKLLAGFCALAVMILLILMYRQEHIIRPWKIYQTEYRQAFIDSAKNSREHEAAHNLPMGINEIRIADLNLTDRCATCHTGISDINNPFTTLPLRKHPDNWLHDHPADQFACTICHGGRGRALDRAIAHSEEYTNPFMPGHSIQAYCAKCHLAVFNNELKIPGAERLLTGLAIFQNSGCLGCHKMRGTGGIIGPDLSHQGEKPPEAYYFDHITGPKTIGNWLQQHFLTPDSVSPGTVMPAFNFSQDSLESIGILIRGFWGPQLPFRYYSSELIREYKSERNIFSGTRAYQFLCSACHGKKGKGRQYTLPSFGVPQLNNPEFLALASQQFIKFTLHEGRGNRMMGAWNKKTSGVQPAEIENLLNYIDRWKPEVPQFKAVQAAAPNKNRGRSLYENNCAFCHGADGLGELGPGLNRPSVLSIASDRFLFRSITEGRANTAMPAWLGLNPQEIADLLYFIRSWQNQPVINLPDFQAAGNIARGDSLFLYQCSRCHGKNGSGGIGPAILNPGFLTQASNAFLKATISGGRDHSPMFGVNQHTGLDQKTIGRQIDDIISFMRSRGNIIPPIPAIGLSLGNSSYGKILFRRSCAECHGDEGQGSKAPALNNQEFLNAASDGFILGTMSIGRSDTAMPSWGRGNKDYPQLSVQDRRDITAFIRTWQTVTIKQPRQSQTDN